MAWHGHGMNDFLSYLSHFSQPQHIPELELELELEPEPEPEFWELREQLRAESVERGAWSLDSRL